MDRGHNMTWAGEVVVSIGWHSINPFRITKLIDGNWGNKWKCRDQGSRKLFVAGSTDGCAHASCCAASEQDCLL